MRQRSHRRAYRPQEVAAMLGVTAKSVRAWCASGLIRATRPTSRCVLIPASEVDRLLGEARNDDREGR